MLILGISKLWSEALGIRFWNFCSTFEIAWAVPICVGGSFSYSPNVLILLRWSFWYIKLRVLIWFRLNPRNLNPRNFHFLVGFLFETIFPCRPLWRHRYQKMWNFLPHLLIYVKSLSHDVPLPKRPRKCFNVDFPYLVPRELVRVWYHRKWFLKLYNLSYSDLSFIRWVQKS